MRELDILKYRKNSQLVRELKYTSIKIGWLWVV